MASSTPRDHWIWPIGLGVVAVIVVAVNLSFVVISKRVAPSVEPSYEHATQR